MQAAYDRQLQEANTEGGKDSLLSSRLKQWQGETESLKAQLASLLALKDKVGVFHFLNRLTGGQTSRACASGVAAAL